jgi:hypothetical protein
MPMTSALGTLRINVTLADRAHVYGQLIVS